jgi:hypothetical protein
MALSEAFKVTTPFHTAHAGIPIFGVAHPGTPICAATSTYLPTSEQLMKRLSSNELWELPYRRIPPR